MTDEGVNLMLSRITLCVVIGLALTVSATVSGSENPTGKIRIEYSGQPNRWGPTVLAVNLVSDGESLTATAETDMDLVAYVSEKGANGIVELLFDVDCDPSTGGITYSAQNSGAGGFEASSSISACKELDGSGYVCAGDTDDFSGFSTRLFPYIWDAETGDFDKFQGWSMRQGVSELDGKSLTVSIPYAAIGVGSGATIRVFVFTHHFSEYPEVELTLQ